VSFYFFTSLFLSLCSHSERNRAHAKKSRQRKKCLTTELHQALESLKEENEKLRAFIYRKIGEGQTEEILSKRRLNSHLQFVSALQSRDNTVVDSKTATFLRGLRKNVFNLNKKSKTSAKAPPALNNSTEDNCSE
jgi:Basic region leucine zipper